MNYNTTRRRQQRNWIDTSPTDGVDLGFGPQYRNSEDWHNNQQRVQILTPREKPPEKQYKICSSCNKKLDWLESSRRFICYVCGISYNELYDKPLSSIEQAIQPLQGKGSDKPVFVNIQRNKKLEGEYQNETIEETRSYHGGRVKHIKLKPGVSPAAYNIREELEKERNDRR